MDVAAYIKELLYQEHAVYVPGLGTFSISKTAGFYNQKQQLFYPPENSVHFIAEEKQDGLLENYISKQKNISQQAAKYFIEKFADQLKNDLGTKNIPIKEALFPSEVGAGAEKEQGYTSFNQENFGLSPVNISPIKETSNFINDKEVITKQDYVENFYREFSSNLPDETEENKRKRSNSFWGALFLLLAFCIIGCYVLYSYYPQLFNRFHSPEESAVIVIQPKVDTVKRDSISQQPAVKNITSIKPAADTIAASSKMAAPAPKPIIKDTAGVEATDPDLVEKSPYEIIGATFRTLKGAKTFVNQLKAKGMRNAKILKNTSGTLKLVTFGSFKDKESAQAAIAKLRARDPNSDAHIQHYNK